MYEIIEIFEINLCRYVSKSAQSRQRSGIVVLEEGVIADTMRGKIEQEYLMSGYS